VSGPRHHLLDVWATTVWCAATPKQLRKVGRRGGPSDLDARGCAGMTFSQVCGTAHHVVVYIDAKHHLTGGGLVNTCAHEASHVADAIFEHVEEETPGDETRAYLVGWVAQWVLEHCDPARTT
jgi:hypothetical protein